MYCCATGGGAGSGSGTKITATDESGFNSWNNDKKRISKNLFKIRHWKIIHDNYINIQNENATWFIDPPYFNGGHKYKHSNKKINYNNLREWCITREGQVIVCENTKAFWLPFNPIIDMYGIRFTTTEAIWTNEKTLYDNTQQKLF